MKLMAETHLPSSVRKVILDPLVVIDACREGLYNIDVCFEFSDFLDFEAIAMLELAEGCLLNAEVRKIILLRLA